MKEQPARHDLYTAIHKACRKKLYDLGSRIQMNDFSDVSATTDLLQDLKHDREMFYGHAMHEEKVIHSEVRRFEPELVARLEEDHVEIERRGDVMAEIVEEIGGLEDPDLLIAAGAKLHQAFNDYMAFFLKHLNYEETTMLPVGCWKHFDDEQLRAMQIAIIQDSTPEENAEWLMGMFSSANDSELAHIVALAEMLPLPEEAKAGMLGMGRKTVGDERWSQIQRGAELLGAMT